MTPDLIAAAAKRLTGHVRQTPMLSSPFLDAIAGRRVLVKAECLQHTGSFKYRGAKSAVTAYVAQGGSAGILAYSSGNHAQGVARAAREAGLAAVIVMPADAPQVKVANTRALGAEVVPYDRFGESREAIGTALSQARGLYLIRPYDEPEVIAGQAGCGLEIAAQAAALGVERADVLVCCGGGGLTSGIALALEGIAPSLRVRTAEPEGFDDVARSLISGRIEVNAPGQTSLCDAIVTPSPGQLTFPIMARLCGAGIAVSDEEALRAVALAYRYLKIVLEPGGAVALAAALFRFDGPEGDAVIAVASGGNVDDAVFRQALSSLPALA